MSTCNRSMLLFLRLGDMCSASKQSVSSVSLGSGRCQIFSTNCNVEVATLTTYPLYSCNRGFQNDLPWIPYSLPNIHKDSQPSKYAAYRSTSFPMATWAPSSHSLESSRPIPPLATDLASPLFLSPFSWSDLLSLPFPSPSFTLL